MANWKQENTILTNIGLTMLSKAQVGLGKLEITKIIARDTVSTPDENKLLTGSTLPDTKQSAVLLSAKGAVIYPDNSQNADASQITARFSNETVGVGQSFKIRQVVVFMRLTELADSDEDMGEVPYMVAQSEGEDDYDFMPEFSVNPTAINYDLYILHSGVAQIDIAVKTAGYVDEDTYNEEITNIWNTINSITANGVGQNTDGMTFDVWTPQYTADDDPSGARNWSKSTDTTQIAGTKSAERFNNYAENDNIAVGIGCHVEGGGNVGISNQCHIEGVDNHSGSDNTLGIHIEGRRNYATIGWFQHIEGELNQSAGYVTHMEGQKNKAINTNSENVGMLHVEGVNNTVNEGTIHHVEGTNNTVDKGNVHHVGGNGNSVSGSGDCCHVGGRSNIVSDTGEALVLGRENIVRNSNQANMTGYKNVIVNSVGASASGTTNTITNSQGANVTGNNNTVNNSRSSTVSGESNTVSDSCLESSVSGYHNSVTRSEHSIISGQNNIISDSNNNIVSGRTNQVTQNVHSSIVSGAGNNVHNDNLASSISNALFGTNGILIDSSEVIISGNGNSATRSFCSILSGKNNSLIKNSSSDSTFSSECSVISGNENTISQTKNSILTGNKNTISDYTPNGVSGERFPTCNIVTSGEINTIYGLFSSVITGYNNSITNIHDSVIGGKGNTISSEVLDSGTNCVLCTGFNCTVNNSGHPMFVTGSYNTINGNNSSVMGSNNIATGYDQVVMGHYNVEDIENKFALIVGGGAKNGENVARKNILELDWEGKLHITGLYVSNIWNEDGTGTLNAWNIADGTGVGAIIANNIAENKASGLYSFAIGNLTESSANYAFSTGNGSKAQGQSAVATGDYCESSADYSFTTGHLAKTKSVSSQAMGHNVSIDASSVSAFMCGYENSASNAFASFTSGQTNTNQSNRGFIAGGQNNVLKSENGFVANKGNTVSGNNNFVAGVTNTVTSGGVTVFGESNKITASSGMTGSLFTGNSNSAKSGIVEATFMSGYKNKINSHSAYDLISGESNTIYNSESSVISGYNNSTYAYHSAIVGYGNQVSGGKNIVGGFQNDVGKSGQQDTFGISCVVSGTSNQCAGINNVLIGEGLKDYYGTEFIAGAPNTNSAFFGYYNDDSQGTLENSVLTIGGGTFTEARTVTRILKSGDIHTSGTVSTNGADLSEWFEWKDGNKLNEDRRGLFVTLDGKNIVLADENTSYIHGIVSARPALVGNNYEDSWNKKYLTDVFGAIIYEDYIVPAETKTVVNENGEEEVIIVVPEKIEQRPMLNPDYDPNEVYIPRSKRPEWSYVASIGRLVVVDDGSCVANGYCKPTTGGIATTSDKGFRVMKRVDDTHILVWIDRAIIF